MNQEKVLRWEKGSKYICSYPYWKEVEIQEGKMQKVEMIESRGHSGNSECPTECSAELRNAFCFCFFIKSSSSKKQTSTLQKFFFPKKVKRIYYMGWRRCKERRNIWKAVDKEGYILVKEGINKVYRENRIKDELK